MWPRRQKAEMAESSREATAARIRAERDLERRLDDTTRVQALTAEWRRIRERNNIAAAFEASLRRGGRA